MSLRMPQSLSTSSRFDTGLSILEAELHAESAVALGRIGRDLEQALAVLSAAEKGAAHRSQLVKATAAACWRYFVQREALGMFDHAHPVAHYAIPGEVLARIGAAD